MIALPPGFTSEEQVRQAAQAFMFPATPTPAATFATSTPAPTGLRIRPLFDSMTAPSGGGGGLQIRPLTDPGESLRAALLNAVSGGPGNTYANGEPNPYPAIPGGGGEGVGAAPAGMSEAGIAAQFGHLAGPNPVAVGIQAAIPSLVGSLFGHNAPNPNTPAGHLTSIFGNIPDLLSSFVGPIAHTMQQTAINQATARQGLVHNEQDLSTIGITAPQSVGFLGTSGTNANFSGSAPTGPDGAPTAPAGYSIAITGHGPNPSLGFFSSGPRGSDDPAPAPDSNSVTADGGVAAPGVTSDGQAAAGISATDGNTGVGAAGDGGASGCLLASYAMDGLSVAQNAQQRQFYRRLGPLFVQVYGPRGQREIVVYQSIAQRIIKRLDELPDDERAEIQHEMYDDLVRPTGTRLDLAEIRGVRSRLMALVVKLAKRLDVPISPRQARTFGVEADKALEGAGITPRSGLADALLATQGGR